MQLEKPAPQPIQTSFFKHEAFRLAFKEVSRRDHGGRLGQGRRKQARPMSPKLPIHVVLRSDRAKGDWSLLRARNQRQAKHLVYSLARRFRVRVLNYANSGNHLHLVLRAKTREGFQGYLRAVAGMIARRVTGAKKGVRKGKFWEALAYSRVVTWGRELKNLNFYVIMNELEALGVWSRKWVTRTPPQGAPPLNQAEQAAPERSRPGLVVRLGRAKAAGDASRSG